MFWITWDPSSGSDDLYLTEITYNGSNVLIMCVIGVWQHIVDLWCVCVCIASDWELLSSILSSQSNVTRTHTTGPERAAKRQPHM